MTGRLVQTSQKGGCQAEEGAGDCHLEAEVANAARTVCCGLHSFCTMRAHVNHST